MSDDRLKLISKSPDETFQLGHSFGMNAFPGGVIGLRGPLGAGKTRFVQGLASGLGIRPSTVKSPTYGLVHFYTDGRLSLCHIDLYRLSNSDEIESLGIEDDLEGEGVAAIEWVDKGLAILPSGRVILEIKDQNGDHREILMHGSDQRHQQWIEQTLTSLPLLQ